MFKLQIYTPNGLYLEDEVTLINVFTNDGQRGILENHMPIVAPTIISRLEIVKNDIKEYFAISDGVAFFKDNVCKIIVESIENKKDIDLSRALDAKKRAEDRINSNDPNIDIKRARIALNKALNRIDIFHLQ